MPPEYEWNMLMEATGWSWPELMATPMDVVRRHQTYLAVKQTKDSGGSMQFDEPG